MCVGKVWCLHYHANPQNFWSMVTQYNFMMMSSKNLTGLYSHPVVKLTEKPQTHQTNIKDLPAIKDDC